jgi:predicted nucleic acid-binding Zn ribbon protein
MANINNLVIKLNDYRVIYMPTHHRAMTNENWEGFVYEHIVVAEEALGRKISDTEVVHHLNGDRSNNRKENLLVLEKSQHGKLHVWLNSGAPGIERLRENGENSLKAKFDPPQFCSNCGTTLQVKQKQYCSQSCKKIGLCKVKRPAKDDLIADVDNMSMLAVGRKYGVSDNAIRKWLKSYGLNKPTMSRASGTPEEGAETSGEVQPLNNHISPPHRNSQMTVMT